MRINILSLFLFTALLVSACGSSSSGELAVRDAWARPASIGENGAAYFVIENGTATNDTLVSVSSEIAAATEVHMSMIMNDDVATMQMQESIPIPVRGQVEFKPGDLHVMLGNLNQDLNIGDIFILTLYFENAGEVTLQVEVKEQP